MIMRIKSIVKFYATYWNSPGFATLRGKFDTPKTAWLRGKTELSNNQVIAFMKTMKTDQKHLRIYMV